MTVAGRIASTTATTTNQFGKICMLQVIHQMAPQVHVSSKVLTAKCTSNH